MIKDIDLDKAIRGNCPKCGGSDLNNLGYFKIDATAWKAQIWMVDGVIIHRFEDVTTLDMIFAESRKSHDLLNNSYFEIDEHGWECQDCHHGFKTGDAKAAILGSSLEKLTQDVLQ